MRSMTSEDGVGDTNTTIQGKELYELEVRFKQNNTSNKAVKCQNVHKALYIKHHKIKSVLVMI